MLAKKKKPQTTMAFAGDPEVIDNILLKKRLLFENDKNHKEIRPLLIMPGGGMLGAIEAGFVVTLEKLRLTNAFDVVVGVSAGAVTGYYLVAGESALGASVVFDDLPKAHLFDLLRIKKIADMEALDYVLRTVKPVNNDILMKARPKLYAVVTNTLSGQAEFVDVKKSKNPISSLVGSSCIPIVSGVPGIEADGHFCVDGSVGDPLPISSAIEKFHPTDVLVVMGYDLTPRKLNLKLIDPILRRFFEEYVNDALRDSLEKSNDKWNAELRFLSGQLGNAQNVRIATLYTTHKDVKEYTMDHPLLQQAVLDAKLFTEYIFTQNNKGIA